jgi:hypothetical protein
MSAITDYLDGLRDGPIFRRDLTGQFDSETINTWLESGRTEPYRILNPFPGPNGDVLIILISTPSPDEEWRDLVNTLRGLDLYRAAQKFRQSR